MASNYSSVGQNLGQFSARVGFDLQHQVARGSDAIVRPTGA